ncbi:MAG: ADOP family duplicated permease [Candidatus Acidiferrales bacterium]
MLTWLRVFSSHALGFFSPRHASNDDRDFAQELDAHLALLTDENIRRGMAPDEAARAARIQLGGVTQLRETHRDLRGLPFLDTLFQDIRFALRILRKSRGFAITTILTLSLGIAACVAIFGFVDSALIRPLPYPKLSLLMGVFKTTQLGSQHAGYSYPDYLDLVRSNRVFASIAAYEGGGYVLSDAGGAHLVTGTGVTSDFFRILGVTPILGRDFAAHPATQDLQSVPSTVILSYAAWQKWFAGRPDVLGKAVTLTTKRQSYTVIGVLPRSFQFAPAGTVDFWTTLRPFAGDPCASSRGCMAMGVIAQLKNGITIQQALADVRAIAAQEARKYPDPDGKRGGNIAPLSQWILGDIQPILLVLLGGAGLLLLIAYVNAAGLLLARSESRRREFAVRGVLGAGRGRLTQQFVTEGFVMVAASSALGFFAATFTRRLLLKLIPADMLDGMPYLRGTVWNWHVIVFATAVALIALVLFAVTPALRLPFANLRAGLTESGRRSGKPGWKHLGAKLIVLELATTMVLLAGAGLLGKSLYRLLHVDLGFVPNHLATLWMMAPESKYSTSEQQIALHREIITRLQSVPGVIGVGTARDLPMSGPGSTQIGFVSRPSLGVNNEVGHQVISAGYLSSVVKAQLLRGRHFNENDNASAPLVGIINETLARRYFPGENPIGKQIFYHANDINRDTSQPPIRIIGIIADIKEYALDSKAAPVIYTPYEQWPVPYKVVVRTSQAAASVLPALIATIHKIDPEILTESGTTMSEIIQGSSAAYLHRATAWLAGGFAALALMLSAVGLYGVISYSVSRRTREIGVRMALGAQRRVVMRLVLVQGARLALVGVAIGLLAAFGLTRLMSSLLYGVSASDPITFAAVAIVLLAVALLACYIPARRAMKVDPMVALRHE